MNDEDIIEFDPDDVVIVLHSDGTGDLIMNKDTENNPGPTEMLGVAIASKLTEPEWVRDLVKEVYGNRRDH